MRTGYHRSRNCCRYSSTCCVDRATNLLTDLSMSSCPFSQLFYRRSHLTSPTLKETKKTFAMASSETLPSSPTSQGSTSKNWPSSESRCYGDSYPVGKQQYAENVVYISLQLTCCLFYQRPDACFRKRTEVCLPLSAMPANAPSQFFPLLRRFLRPAKSQGCRDKLPKR